VNNKEEIIAVIRSNWAFFQNIFASPFPQMCDEKERKTHTNGGATFFIYFFRVVHAAITGTMEEREGKSCGHRENSKGKSYNLFQN
jgi:hypothetical protein